MSSEQSGANNMKKGSIKVSIITVTYNSVQTLGDTIESVLSQKGVDCEHIIIDGASTDGTVDLIKSYDEKYLGKLKWISSQDRGIYDAINKGIELAEGDVVGVLNSDDFYKYEWSLSRLVEPFQDESIGAVYADLEYVLPQDLNRCIRYYSSAIFRPSLMRLGFIPAHPTFYMRRDLIKQIGMYRIEYRIAADFEFLLRALYVHRIKTCYIPESLITMRVGGISTRGMESHRVIMKEHLKACKEHGVYTNVVILSLRYVYKVYEVLYTRLRLKKKSKNINGINRQ